MSSRREFVLGAVGSVGAMAGLPSCSSETNADSYENVAERSENDKYAKHVRSSAGLAIVVSDTPGPGQWVEMGRCYERFALQAAALDIRNALLNQPVEVSTLRPQFAAFRGVGKHRPDLVVRFGRGPKLSASLRRPVQAVLV